MRITTTFVANLLNGIDKSYMWGKKLIDSTYQYLFVRDIIHRQYYIVLMNSKKSNRNAVSLLSVSEGLKV